MKNCSSATRRLEAARADAPPGREFHTLVTRARFSAQRRFQITERRRDPPPRIGRAGTMPIAKAPSARRGATAPGPIPRCCRSCCPPTPKVDLQVAGRRREHGNVTRDRRCAEPAAHAVGSTHEWVPSTQGQPGIVVSCSRNSEVSEISPALVSNQPTAASALHRRTSLLAAPVDCRAFQIPGQDSQRRRPARARLMATDAHAAVRVLCRGQPFSRGRRRHHGHGPRARGAAQAVGSAAGAVARRYRQSDWHSRKSSAAVTDFIRRPRPDKSRNTHERYRRQTRNPTSRYACGGLRAVRCNRKSRQYLSQALLLFVQPHGSNDQTFPANLTFQESELGFQCMGQCDRATLHVEWVSRPFLTFPSEWIFSASRTILKRRRAASRHLLPSSMCVFGTIPERFIAGRLKSLRARRNVVN